MQSLPQQQQTTAQQEVTAGTISEMRTHEAKFQLDMKAELERLRAELAPAPPEELISAAQVAALQSRLERLHSAELLTDEVYFALENLVADFLELKMAVGVLTREVVFSGPGDAYERAALLAKLVGVSEGLESDASAARQLRRKAGLG